MTLISLSCASCSLPHDTTSIATLCTQCGRSLTAGYDIGPLAHALSTRSMNERPRSMWRYAEALPMPSKNRPISLGEGWTPLLEAPRFGKQVGLPHLFVKEEGANPTGSFKARGMSAAVTAAYSLGVRAFSAPSAGNAAGALAAYAARAGVEAHVYLPDDAPLPNRTEARLCGVDVVTVAGTIADAAAALRKRREIDPSGAGWLDVSTLKEPYRLDGKKTMGYELFEQFGNQLPDAILYPTGGGTGLLGMMKAFDELEREGLLGPARPKMIAVQAEGCAPIVDAWNNGRDDSDVSSAPATIASGLLVPKAFADWWILKELRRSDGCAVAVSDDEMVQAIRDFAASEGLLLSPEGAALVAALPRLIDERVLLASDRIVFFNTASPYKYPDVLARALGDA